MITKSTSSCLQASSTLTLLRYSAYNQASTSKSALRRQNAVFLRKYASKESPRTHKTPSALQPQRLRPDTTPLSLDDRLNPPASTRPPPLNLPTRGNENVAWYYFRIGRAYGTFYKDGLKAVWRNHKASSALKKRIFDELNAGTARQQARNWRTIRVETVNKGLLTRAEFQLLERNSYDIGKLPFFGLLVVIFGEWLPLLVPFMPGAVPGTCRIPKQIEGMRKKAEARRRVTFRSGVTEPERGLVTLDQSKEEKSKEWPLVRSVDVRQMLGKLRNDQLWHMSTTLNLHAGLWDTLQLQPPAMLLRRKIASRFQYIALDDQLLLHHGGVKKLEPDEVLTACDERGIDVLGRKDAALRDTLKKWLERQQKDRGRGSALVEMLFRRPNVWTDRS